LVVDTSIGGQRVVRELDALIARRGRPAMIVSDNGTELTSRAVLEWTNRIGHPVALHRAWQANPERLRRKLHRQVSRRVPERGDVRQPGRGPCCHRALAMRLQPGATALGPPRPHPRGRAPPVRGRPAAQPRPAPPHARYHRAAGATMNHQDSHSHCGTVGEQVNQHLALASPHHPTTIVGVPARCSTRQRISHKRRIRQQPVYEKDSHLPRILWFVGVAVEGRASPAALQLTGLTTPSCTTSASGSTSPTHPLPYWRSGTLSSQASRHHGYMALGQKCRQSL
jgi:hypothetical protein